MSASNAADDFHPLPWLIPLCAGATAAAGVGIEIAAHQLLQPRHAVWLLRPFLYSGLPKPYVHTNWTNVLVMAAVFAAALFITLLAWSQPTKPAPLIRVGIGLLLGASLGQAAMGIVLATSTNVFVVTRGDWGYAFSAFDVPIAVGLLMVLPDFLLPGSRLLRHPNAALGLRGLFRREWLEQARPTNDASGHGASTYQRLDWGSWVWVVVGALLVMSLVLFVGDQQRLSDYCAALGFFTAFAGVMRMPGFWNSRFRSRTASLLRLGFAIVFVALTFATLWSFNWVRAARVSLDFAGVVILALLLAVMRRPTQSA